MICQRCGIETTGNSICENCKKFLFKRESTKICESIDMLGIALEQIVFELRKMNNLSEGK